MAAATIETVLQAVLTPEAVVRARPIPASERSEALAAILSAFRDLRLGDEKLEDVCRRIGPSALVERAAGVSTS